MMTDAGMSWAESRGVPASSRSATPQTFQRPDGCRAEIPLPGSTGRSVYCGPLERNGEVSMKRTFLIAAASLLLVGFGASVAPTPSFTVDPLWPKPLPNHWLLGSITGVAVDARDHIWVVHRGGDSLNARTEMGA